MSYFGGKYVMFKFNYCFSFLASKYMYAIHFLFKSGIIKVHTYKNWISAYFYVLSFIEIYFLKATLYSKSSKLLFEQGFVYSIEKWLVEY